MRLKAGFWIIVALTFLPWHAARQAETFARMYEMEAAVAGGTEAWKKHELAAQFREAGQVADKAVWWMPWIGLALVILIWRFSNGKSGNRRDAPGGRVPGAEKAGQKRPAAEGEAEAGS